MKTPQDVYFKKMQVPHLRSNGKFAPHCSVITLNSTIRNTDGSVRSGLSVKGIVQ